MTNSRFFLISGSLSAFISIAAGAFGAHLLKTHLSAEMLSVFETAVRYQMYHALALCIVAVVIRTHPGKWGHTAGWLFILGTVLFSGSLYVLSMTGIRWLGAITPLGGVAFLLGWVGLAMHAFKMEDVTP